MEGIYFYWIAWIGWVFTTFLMGKSHNRVYLTIAILTIISLATIEIFIFDYGINVAFIFLILACYWQLSKLPFLNRAYYLAATIIIAFTYVGFSLFALYDPVWVIFHYSWMLAICIFILNLFLVKKQHLRIISIIVGTAHGEILYAIIIKNIFPEYLIGNLMYFDTLAITIALTFMWYVFEQLVASFDNYIKRRERKKDIVVN